MTEMQMIEAGGIAMDYTVSGAPDAPPVLLIHGLGWDAARLWGGVLSALAEAGFRAYAPNLRGVGGTAATDAAYTTDLYAQDLEAFLEALGIDRLPVVGFSMGASDRGRIGGAVRSGDGPDTRLRWSPWHGGRPPRGGGDAGAGRNAGARRLRRGTGRGDLSPAWAAANPAAVEDFKRWRSEMNQDALFRAFRSGYGVDMRAVVQGAGLPTQVIAADTDAFCELDDMRAMAEAIPGARFDVIEACGHMATVEQLDAFNTALLGFLRDRGARHENRAGHGLGPVRGPSR
jgi:pimeloyl-ACP methyl ester carboxylesterase